MSAADANIFELPVTVLTGVGRTMAEKLSRIGVERVGDLVFLVPQRFEDRTERRRIGGLRPGAKALVEGEIELAEVVRGRRRSLLCRLSDGTGNLTLRFFHFSDLQRRRLQRGAHLRAFGEVRFGRTGLEMVHPELAFVEPGKSDLEATMTPVYPATEGLHQQRIRRFVDQALRHLERESPEDFLAPELDASWPSLIDAVKNLHGPAPGTEAAQGDARNVFRRRLALEELVAHRLSLKLASEVERSTPAAALAVSHDALARFVGSLEFRLTGAQRRVIDEICADLGRDRPMHRLLQGDVGCGKTVVAAAVAMSVAESGHQAALMAPTELLAEQHFARFDEWFGPLGISLAYLSGSMTGKARAQALEHVRTGEAQIVIGTHALFQEAVDFNRLSLVIVDEQHRFGVEQRLGLMRKSERGGTLAHQLIMTATPIPRTLAMTIYADLDCSVIDELPRGRQAVRTAAMPERRRAELVRRIAEHCAAGQQAYWICPLIDESQALESSAASALEKELAGALPELTVGLVHGRKSAAEKDHVMRRFKAGEIDLLVATTVIEVGVDVANATLMVIENSERMGLAQLHQLRGRVGRGSEASHCVLLYKPPLNEVARRRLEVMRKTNDGFEIAALDLKLRGAGEVLGTRQTGAMNLRIADLLEDMDLLGQAVQLSDSLLERRRDAAERLIRRWIKGPTDYARV